MRGRSGRPESSEGAGRKGQVVLSRSIDDREEVIVEVRCQLCSLVSLIIDCNVLLASSPSFPFFSLLFSFSLPIAANKKTTTDRCSIKIVDSLIIHSKGNILLLLRNHIFSTVLSIVFFVFFVFLLQSSFVCGFACSRRVSSVARPLSPTGETARAWATTR